jgi:Tol biopolymer transport system component
MGGTVAFWSPDGRFIAFIADRKLKKIAVSGGPAITLADAQQGGGGGSWSAGDVIVFSTTARSSELSRIDAAGGPVTPATTLDTAAGDKNHWWPYFLPDGKHFLYEAIGSSASV